MAIEDKYLKEYGETYLKIPETEVRKATMTIWADFHKSLEQLADKFSSDRGEQKRFKEEVISYFKILMKNSYRIT